MVNVCPISKKRSVVGGGYSNKTRATKFNPTGKTRKKVNFQTKKLFVPELNRNVSVKLSTNAMRTIKKNGTYKTLKKFGVI